MKRKLFSAILFGALLTASTSGLTSCKDYDDDISNLQSQIDKLATADQLSAKVSEMQAAISAAQSAAESKAANAQTVADAAKAAAADAAAAASKAQSTADGATQAAKDAAAAAAAADEVAKAAQAAVDKLAAEGHATKAELEDAAKAAQAYVDSVKKTIEETHAADQARIEQAINDGLEAVKAEIAETNKKLDALDVRLKAVEDKLAAIEAGEGEGSLAEIQAEVNAIADDLKAIIGEYTSMVTAVSLYASDEVDTDDLLKFVYVSQEKDTKFPAKEGVADAQIEFSSANKNVMTTDKLLVRVSPTNAVLNAANISLLNSQGADLSDYVEVKAVKPYEKLILGNTRAAVEGNGLWEVEFKVKDGVDAAKFADAVSVKKGLTTYGIKYAVAVQNTESDETRRVISAYDVEVLPEEYEPASTEIAVTNRDGKWWSIWGIKNRYQYNGDNKPGNIVAESATQVEKASELAWVNKPDVAGGSEPTVQDRSDARSSSWYNLVDVEVGKSIDIFISGYGWNSEYVYANNPKNGTSDVVKGFYVVLDSDNAIESAPSEINAWESYSYTNVGVPGDKSRPAKMFYGNEGSISIDSPAAVGDIIGFRVYVVNLDGTLVDPDGRAFYVNVAKEKVVTPAAADELVATLHPTKDGDKYEYHFVGDVNSNYYVAADLTDAAKSAAASATSLYDLRWTITKNASAYGNNSVDPVYGTDYTISIADKKHIVVTIKRPWMFLDEGTYTAVATLKNSNGTEICDLSVDFKKTLPTAAPVLAWNPAYNPANQIFANAAPDDADIYKIAKGNEPQAVELSEIMGDLTYGNLNSDYPAGWYTLEFANAAKDDMNKYTKVLTVPYAVPTVSGPRDIYEALSSRSSLSNNPAVLSSYQLAPEAGAIDGESHSIAYKYNFGWISMTFNYQTAQYTMGECVRYAEAPLAMTFASWIKYEQIAWAKNSQPTVTYSPGNAGKEAARINLLGSDKVPGTVEPQPVKQGVSIIIEDNTLTYYRVLSDGRYIKCNQNGKVEKSSAFGGGYFNDNSEANILAHLDQTTQLTTAPTEYSEVPNDDYTVIATYTADAYWKQISNGDWYKVVYDATAETWKFVKNGTTTILDNQSEANVEKNGKKAVDGKDKYEVIIVQTVKGEDTPAKGSILIAWNTMIRNYQNGESVFGESADKPVDFIDLKNKGYIVITGVKADSASPFDITLDGNELVFTNKVGQLNPGSTGTIKVTAKDCFGLEITRTLEYKIKQ